MLLVIVLLLTNMGCSTDHKDIERLAYASAIGVDYIEGKYYCYVQLFDFQSIGKTEGQRKQARIWVGKGVADSFEEAIFELYRSSQERIFWGHITAVVVSESAFKQGIENFYDIISRYYEFRLTPWVFGTRGSVSDILSVGGFFGQSPLSTILHEPEGSYAQSSTIKPIKLHRLIGEFNEPGYTTCVPTLSLNTKLWKEEEKPEPKLVIDGAIFLKDRAFRSYIPLKELIGMRWVQSGSKRGGIPIPGVGKSSVQLAVENPKAKLKLVKGDGTPRLGLHVKASAYLVSRIDNRLADLQQLSQSTKDAIEKEIRDLYKAGLKRKTDILNLEHHLYRYHYNQWKSIAEEQMLTENSLSDVHIELNIIHSSSEKNTTIQSQR